MRCQGESSARGFGAPHLLAEDIEDFSQQREMGKDSAPSAWGGSESCRGGFWGPQWLCWPWEGAGAVPEAGCECGAPQRRCQLTLGREGRRQSQPDPIPSSFRAPAKSAQSCFYKGGVPCTWLPPAHCSWGAARPHGASPLHQTEQCSEPAQLPGAGSGLTKEQGCLTAP